MLLEQVVALRYLEAVEPSALATTYVFTNSDAVRRPLWTYAAEARGAGVVLVYYSVNNFPLSAAEGIRWNEGSGDCFLTWSDYRTMSPTHARHLEAVVRRPASVAVCELIDFSDDGEPVPAIPSPSCAAFDVVPFRATYRAERGALDAFYTSDLALRFLDDVHGVLANHGVAMVLKPKRSDNSFTDEGYLAALDRLAELPGVELVDPWIAPRRVAAATDMTISLVFTTPGLIAARLGRPSVFYDPSGALVGEMPTFDGVPVIGSRDDLDRWVASTLADLPAPGADTIAR